MNKDRLYVSRKEIKKKVLFIGHCLSLKDVEYYQLNRLK
jgi:hypothetical protein